MDNSNGLSPSASAMVQASAALASAREWLRLPDDYIGRMPGLALSDADRVIYRGEPLYIHEFMDEAWLDYLRAYENHMSACGDPAVKAYRVVKFSRTDLNTAVDSWRRKELARLRMELAASLAYDGVGSPAHAEAFVRLVTGRCERGDVGALLHAIWQIKRKMNGLRTGWEQMFVLYNGDHGSGKSTAIEVLLSPVEQFHCSASLSDITDPRWRGMLADNVALTVSELSGADRASMEELKRLITEPSVGYRPLHKNTVVKIKQNCTFFGSSNQEISEVLHDEQMRRFYQMTTLDLIDKDAVRAFDVVSLWRSVDESRPLGYYEDYAEAFVANRKQIESGEPLAVWLDECDLRPGDSDCASVDELYQSYRSFLEAGGYRVIPNIRKFGAQLARKKFRHERPRISKQKCTVYFFEAGSAIKSIVSQFVLTKNKPEPDDVFCIRPLL